MAWNKVRDLHVEFLAEEGFRPKVDEEGEIQFRFEGRNHVITESSDDGYFHLLFPSFFPLTNEDEVAEAALAASAATRATKVAKVYLNPRMDAVSASVELLVMRPEDVHAHLIDCLGMLATATGMFLEDMRTRLGAGKPA